MRYLLCLLDCGLNDIFCQIQDCWRYAQKYKRILVIDTRYSGLHDRFDHYFLSDHAKIVLHPDGNLIKEMNRLKTFPSCLSGGIYPYIEEHGYGFHSSIDHPDKILSFDFSHDYPEEVLVHHRGGGGLHSLKCFAKFFLQRTLAARIKQQLASLKRSYYALHVRNTDYKTDYRPFFESIAPCLAGKQLLICSDDWQCREYARNFFVDSEVVTITDIPRTNNRPLHYLMDNIQKNNTDMLTDLLALAGAKKLFYTAASMNGEPSGFSTLADGLRKRRDLRNFLLSGRAGLFFKAKHHLRGFL